MWQVYSVLFSAVLGFVLAKWGLDLGFNPKCLKNTGFNHHYSITIIT